jgi:hypothetical protein
MCPASQVDSWRFRLNRSGVKPAQFKHAIAPKLSRPPSARPLQRRGIGLRPLTRIVRVPFRKGFCFALLRTR